MRRVRELSILLCFTLVFSIAGLFQPQQAVQAFTDPGNISDESFFGKWNPSTLQWTTPSKLNYSYNAAMTAIGNTVKGVQNGDYSTAKEELLQYYKNRSDRTAPPLTLIDSNPTVSSLTYEGYYYDIGYGEKFVQKASVTDTYQPVTADVTTSMTNAFNGKKQFVSYILMGADKNGIDMTFYSKEYSSGAYKPVITVQYAGGATQTFQVSQDTYIQPGANASADFGSAHELYVQDSGDATLPYDSQTKRAYFTFDVGALSSVPLSATVQFYGKSASGTNDILVLENFDTSWFENSKNWSNTRSSFFSWRGIPTLTTWDDFQGTDIAYFYDVSRFFFAVPMAYEYAVNGNDAYAHKLIEITLDLIGDKGAGYPRGLETGLRDLNLVRAYDSFRTAPSLDREANTSILKFLEAEGAFLEQNRNFNDSNNIGTANIVGMYVLAVYFPEFQRSSRWQDLVEIRSNYIFRELSYPDTSYKEASTGYNGVTINILNIILDWGTLNGQVLSDSFKKNLQDMALYFVRSNYPNGLQTQYGDTDVQNRTTTMLDIGNKLGSNDLIYFGSRGLSGTEPATGSEFYPDGKMLFMRTGWQNNDLFLHLNNKHGYHGHFDDLSVLPYAYGRALLVDPGRFSYSVGDPIEQWLRSTKAHNTIEINDKNQYQYTNSSKNDWSTNSLFDFYEGSNDGYIKDKIRQTRSILFLKPNYWIVSDYIDVGTNTNVNKYNQTWHFAPSDNPGYDNVTQRVYSQSGEAELQIVPVNDPGLTLSMESGYYAFRYGTVTAAAYASYVKQQAGNVAFDTVLYPTPTGVSATVQTTRLPLNVPSDVASALSIEISPTERGSYYISHENNPVVQRQFGSYLFNGKMAYVGEDGSGNVTDASIRGGTRLARVQSGVPVNLVQSTSPVHDLGVQWKSASNQVVIAGPTMKPALSTTGAVAVYAPASYTSLVLNGVTYASSAFVRSGNYVYVQVDAVASEVASVPEVGYVANYDYNTDDLGLPPSNWIIREYAGTIKVVNDTVDAAGHGQVVRLEKSSNVSLQPELTSGVEVSAIRMLPVLKGKVTIDMDLRTDETTDSKSINVNDDVGVGGISILLNNGVFQAYINGSYYTLQTFNANTWYHVRAVANTETGTFDLYIDGQKQISNAPLRNPIYNIGQFYSGLSGSSIGTLYTDNIKIYQIIPDVQDTFDQDIDGGLPAGWISSTSNGSIAVENLASRIDKSVKLSRSSASDPAATVLRNFTAMSGKVTIESRIRTDNTTLFKMAPYVLDNSNNPAISLSIGNGKLRSYHNNAYHDVQTLNNNQWYAVKIELDTDTDTADIIVDGVKRLTGVPLRTAVTAVSKVKFDLSSTNTGHLYFDDVKIYQTPPPNPTAPVYTAPVIVSQTFDAGTTGTAPASWTIDTGSSAGSSVEVAEFPSATDKSMKLTKPNAAGAMMAALPLNKLKGQTRIDAMVYASAATGTFNVPVVRDSVGNTVTSLSFDQGYIKVNVNGTWQTLQAYTAGNWYRLQLLLDTDKRVFNVSVNETELLYKVPMPSNIVDLDVIQYAIPASTTGHVYVDNLLVTQNAPAISNNFESETVGNEPAHGFAVKAGADVQIVEASGNRSMKITKANLENDAVVGWGITNASGGGMDGTVRISLKVKTDETAGKKNVFIYDDAGLMVGRLLLINGNFQAYDGAALKTVRSFTSNTWYTIDMVVNTVTDTYQLFIDGVLWQVATTPTVRTDANLRLTVQALSSIRFTVQNGDVGTLYVDDLTVR
ncbi:heparinase II/III family protein [Paenibacillus koleovorans]|uniref:heparinase II/III family protein n=1 Tax=Paenibacillus koleovorans TaxID=121608 RepID=UPI000FD6C102|nr:heparinase II/III family protein [Paenibacillus koleovorans]